MQPNINIYVYKRVLMFNNVINLDGSYIYLCIDIIKVGRYLSWRMY